ncbi:MULTISPECIES: hypothetical protein [Bacillaceae]|uniref:Uncharacterized protein n=1 Tax=Evansella alkalicola TaxID=745819 RepID=A0ABS6JZN9_9BACI|nr:MULTISPECIES: hypothetical protein [Bacillaceae]MBU9723556.1 hypothetical protein [Bacillus alkalicola]
MKKAIEFIFGKPERNNKFLLAAYWFFIVIYFVFLVSVTVLTLDLVPILVFAIVFPILFRVVYRLNAYIFKDIDTKRLLIIGGIFGFIIIGFTAVVFIFADNMVINESRVVHNGNLQVSIGKLKGDYHLTDFTVEGEGLLLIPYTVEVGTGEVALYMERNNEVLWEKFVEGLAEGFIEIQAELGTYNIGIVTDEADNIVIQLSNP